MTDQNNQSNNKFSKGQTVYFTAFLKKDKNTFYVCKGEILEVPQANERHVYKVKVQAISDRPIGGKPIVEQAQLLGITVTKRTRELTTQLNPFMTPTNWIDKAPKDIVKYGPTPSRGNSLKETRNSETRNGKTKRNRQKKTKTLSTGGHSNPKLAPSE